MFINVKLFEAIFFLLNQPIRNKIPIRNAGPAIVKDQDKAVPIGTLLKVQIIYNNPAEINVIAPTNLCFQDMITRISKINAGILCINKARAISQKLKFSAKTSNEKSIKNKMNIIDKILGVQYINLLIFFIIFPSFFYTDGSVGLFKTYLYKLYIFFYILF